MRCECSSTGVFSLQYGGTVAVAYFVDSETQTSYLPFVLLT